jgi:hypothetical protein
MAPPVVFAAYFVVIGYADNNKIKRSFLGYAWLLAALFCLSWAEPTTYGAITA